MFKGLTQRAQRVLTVLAQEEAKRFHSDQLQPEHVVLALLKDGDGVAVRVYNIADEFVMAPLRLGAPTGEGEYVDLNEENPAPLVVQGGAVRLTLKPNEITTILFGG